MVGMSELSDQKCKITMINILKALMDKVEIMQEQMDNASRDGNPLKETKR